MCLQFLPDTSSVRFLGSWGVLDLLASDLLTQMPQMGLALCLPSPVAPSCLHFEEWTSCKTSTANLFGLTEHLPASVLALLQQLLVLCVLLLVYSSHMLFPGPSKFLNDWVFSRWPEWLRDSVLQKIQLFIQVHAQLLVEGYIHFSFYLSFSGVFCYYFLLADNIS